MQAITLKTLRVKGKGYWGVLRDSCWGKICGLVRNQDEISKDA